jgi:hypothetical protein
MPEKSVPKFDDFTRWVAAMGRVSTSTLPSERLIKSARAAREASLRQLAAPIGRRETLTLLAAATEDSGVPPELITARGFRVSIVYGDSPAGGVSLCVLVQCPAALAPKLVGRTAYLWNGDHRFELGQFDPDGRAIGTLPAGIEISVSDFQHGAVQLEEPDAPPDEA